MKKAINFLILCLLVLFSVSNAQPPVTNATYSRGNQDFYLRYADSIGGGITVTLFAQYEVSTRRFTLRYIRPGVSSDSTVLLNLGQPLNYDFFYHAFHTELAKVITGLKPLSDASVQSVFTWMYALTAGTEDDIVNAANLCLRRWIYVFDKTNPNLDGSEHFKDRSLTIDTITNKYIASELQLTLAKNAFDSALATQLSFVIDTTSEHSAIVQANADLTAAQKKAASTDDDIQKAKAAYTQKANDYTVEKGRVDSLQSAFDTAKADKQPAIYKAIADQAKIVNAKNGDKAKAQDMQDAIEDNKKALLKAVEDARKTLTEKQAAGAAKAKAQRKAGDIRIDVLTPMLNTLRAGYYTQRNAYLIDKNKLKKEEVSATVDKAADEYFSEVELQRQIKETLRKNGIYHVNRISLQFERGFLERMQVWVDNGYGTGERMFENIYAIGTTSISNLKNFTRNKLFLRPFSTPEYVWMGDALGNYDNFLDQFTRDYSPGDTVLNNIDPSATPFLSLRKERLVRLFDTKIFTDLQGLRADEPNGLIQIEAQRRFNINTVRRQSFKRNDYGILNSLTAYGALTKLEEKNRRLLLRNDGFIVNNALTSPSYATTLDFRQWENFSLGLNLNILLYDIPDGKVTAYLNTGLRYGHTPIIDTLRRVNASGRLDTPGKALMLDAHSFTWQLPEISVELFSERRVGLILSYQYNYTRQYSNNNYKPVVSYAKSDHNALPIEPFAHWYHMFEFFMRVETSRESNGKLFLRARYFMQRGDVNTFFPQMQIGYAYNIIFRK